MILKKIFILLLFWSFEQMKLVCLDFDMCGSITFYPKEKSFTKEQLSKPFTICDQCSSLAILVKDDFSVNQERQYLYELYNASILSRLPNKKSR